MTIQTAGVLTERRSVTILLTLFGGLWLVNGSNISRHSFHFVENPALPHTHTAFEGETVDLICQQEKTDDVSIVGNGNYYVDRGEVDQDLPDNIKVSNNGTTFVVTINSVTRNNTGNFLCTTPVPVSKELKLQVFYSPSGDHPRCTSNYEHQFFFDDQLQVSYQFNCTTKEGDPPVNITLYTETEGERQQVNKSDFNITEQHLSKSLSFSPYLNSSFDNTTLICNVTQQLPAPYHVYQDVCSLGPLMLLPTFSISIHPPNYTVNTDERENITFTCTSNVSGVLLNWTSSGFPDNWQYNINMINGSLQLTLFYYESCIDGSKFIQCTGSYGGRSSSQIVTIDTCGGEKEPRPSALIVQLIVSVSLIIVVVIIVIVAAFIVHTNTKGRKRMISHEMTGSTNVEPTPSHSSNVNNANNTESESHHGGNDVLNGETAMNSLDDAEMVDNPIYGSRSNQNRITEKCDSDRSNSSIDMTENVTYESHELKGHSMEDHEEGGNYDTISV